ncbi:MAG TPA: NHLP bacteriocin system secretion protein [Bacillota bacterium]|mgnify:CR=1 FL=1|nr:NHLP bacteriocin system secretion protein [Bacillota bacterium]
MQENLYRKEALKHLETPGQLDTLMAVTSPRGWLALAAAGFLLAAAIVWGTLGSLSISTAGQGIILRPGGIIQAAAMTGGLAGKVLAAPGDLVQPGEVLFSVSRPEQAEEGRPGGETVQVTRLAASQPCRVLDVLVKEGDLLKAGDPVMILEPDSGGESLEAVIYVPAEEGKKIRPGMDALISPASVKKEEHGYLRGQVKSVSGYPSTFEGIVREVGSKELAQRLMGAGAPIAVRVSLTRNPGAPSGYSWTNGKGPDLPVNSGVLCQGSIIVRKVRPVSLLFPALTGR